MSIHPIIDSISAEIDSQNYVIQAIFDRHIHDIELLKANGVTYKRIMDLLNQQLQTKHFQYANFSTLIFRAKQKINNPTQTTQNPTAQTIKPTSKPATEKQGINKANQTPNAFKFNAKPNKEDLI